MESLARTNSLFFETCFSDLRRDARTQQTWSKCFPTSTRTAPHLRTAASLTSLNRSFLPFLRWNICGTRWWLQPFGSWRELICRKAIKFEPRSSRRARRALRALGLPGSAPVALRVDGLFVVQRGGKPIAWLRFMSRTAVYSRTSTTSNINLLVLTELCVKYV